jgi:hypothetical protein
MTSHRIQLIDQIKSVAHHLSEKIYIHTHTLHHISARNGIVKNSRVILHANLIWASSYRHAAGPFTEPNFCCLAKMTILTEWPTAGCSSIQARKCARTHARTRSKILLQNPFLGTDEEGE